MIDSLTLVTKKKTFITKFNSDNMVCETNIEHLLNKSNSYVWKWARMNQAKVYLSDTLPLKLRKECLNV